MAEERMLKLVQLSLFQKNATSPTAAGARFLPVPSDFLAPMALSLTGADGDKVFVEFKELSFVQSYTPDVSTTGTPRYYAQFDNDYLLLGPTPDAIYTAQLEYLYRPVSLTAGADSGTTWLSENAELGMLYGSLVEANIFLKGDPTMTQLYQSRFQEAISGLKLLGEAKQTTDEYRTGEVVRKKQ
tara:strand:- start:902 stop:1456 length:555 start_codon:yes stop_codon:yes gene_type:complete